MRMLKQTIEETFRMIQSHLLCANDANIRVNVIKWDCIYTIFFILLEVSFYVMICLSVVRPSFC